MPVKTVAEIAQADGKEFSQNLCTPIQGSERPELEACFYACHRPLIGVVRIQRDHRHLDKIAMPCRR